MNKLTKPNTSDVRAEQVTNAQYDHIYLGVDLHKKTIVVTRIIDGATPEPARRMGWPQFWEFVAQQQKLARQVHGVYEAGTFGFWPCRRLRQRGVEAYVIHPEKLDPRNRRVQTDGSDSLQLALKVQRYVGGNTKAMTVVYVPSETEEQDRLLARHRDQLAQRMRALQARGRGLLLSQGVFEGNSWYRPKAWEKLQGQIPSSLERVLKDLLTSIDQVAQQLAAVEKELAAAAPQQLPKGFGKLTFVLLLRLICNYARFATRRQVGGFTGLCGGVSASGDYHLDLSINKAGGARVRTLLIEAAWRMIYYQPNYTGLRTWKRLGATGASKRRRKIALVATGRQLMVDLWRWQTGRVRAEELGWIMSGTG
jgi:transposase